jgi:hypothetical protein
MESGKLYMKDLNCRIVKNQAVFHLHPPSFTMETVHQSASCFITACSWASQLPPSPEEMPPPSHCFVFIHHVPII